MKIKKLFIGKPIQSFTDAVAQLEFAKNVKFVQMEQVHKTGIVEVEKDGLILDVDACYTTKKNLFLSVKSADCLPILISGFTENHNIKQSEHTKQNASLMPFIAAAHAGRKSTQLHILASLLEELNAKFSFIQMIKTTNQPLNVWFGPAICEKCYQVDRLTNSHFNLIEENKKQLFDYFKKYDLDPKKSMNLETENHCTLHEPQHYYSFRATGPGVKMNYSFIGIV